MMNKFLLLFLFPASLALAGDICTRTQLSIKSMLSSPASRISFENGGGLINGGVCWWHSRLQRSSVYLTKFEPHRKKPSFPELYKILHSLRTMKEVAIIPGFSDFESFTREHENEVQAMLEDWQKIDGFLNFEWIRGISGRFDLYPLAMKKRMDDIYRYYKNSPSPLWIMAQIKGITSHSLLILNMSQNEIGYEMDVIDSNHPKKTLRISYQHGERSLKNDSYTFVPYVGFQNDFRLISRTVSTECPGRFADEMAEIEDGQIETNYLQY